MDKESIVRVNIVKRHLWKHCLKVVKHNQSDMRQKLYYMEILNTMIKI